MKPPIPMDFTRLSHKHYKRHLHSPRETLARLARDTCTAHEQHKCGTNPSPERLPDRSVDDNLTAGITVFRILFLLHNAQHQCYQSDTSHKHQYHYE